MGLGVCIWLFPRIGAACGRYLDLTICILIRQGYSLPQYKGYLETGRGWCNLAPLTAAKSFNWRYRAVQESLHPRAHTFCYIHGSWACQNDMVAPPPKSKTPNIESCSMTRIRSCRLCFDKEGGFLHEFKPGCRAQ